MKKHSITVLIHIIVAVIVADPRLTDYDTLLENIYGLKAGRAVQVPIYDFKSSSRIGYK